MTQTYKYYIDFQAEFVGIPYIILDEGWYKLGNVLEVVAEINMEELTAYAEQPRGSHLVGHVKTWTISLYRRWINTKNGASRESR